MTKKIINIQHFETQMKYTYSNRMLIKNILQHHLTFIILKLLSEHCFIIKVLYKNKLGTALGLRKKIFAN